jgi:hypothetical protein
MHIKKVSSGDFVRIRLFSRQPLVYKSLGVGTYELIIGEPSKRDKTWDSAVLTGGVIDNNPETGILRIGVVNQQGPDKVMRATIPYSRINILQIAIVDVQEVTVPEFLKGIPLKPRIKYKRVSF